VNDLHEEMRFKIMDEDVGKDDEVGFGLLKVSAMCINHGIREWFSVSHKSKLSGQVLMETKYIESAGVAKPGAQMAMHQ